MDRISPPWRLHDKGQTTGDSGRDAPVVSGVCRLGFVVGGSVCLLCSYFLGCSSSSQGNEDRGISTGGAGGSATSTAVADSGVCLDYAYAVDEGKIKSDKLTEVSGVVESRSQPGVLFVHNDDGDESRFYALDEHGTLLGIYSLVGATNVDWEDISIGPAEGAQSFADADADVDADVEKTTPSTLGVLYLGDIGDNAASDGDGGRSSIVIYRTGEPVVTLGQAAAQGSMSDWQALTLTYPDSPHDAEAMFVDPVNNDLYILTKESSGKTKVYRAAAPLSFGGSMQLQKIASLPLQDWGAGAEATGADISPSGNAVLVRTHTSVALWPRASYQSVANALESRPTLVTAPEEKQGEAIGFSGDGSGYYTISEGDGAHVHYVGARCPH